MGVPQGFDPDVLGEGFSARPLSLGRDDEGELFATLVRYQPPSVSANSVCRPLTGVSVLYLHGWSDYFFQRHVAEFFSSLGAEFYALDLRKYGRSLRPGQTPTSVNSLDEYDEDIDAARAVIGRERRLLVVGHSTGGLIAALWAARHRDAVTGLVLNSPWLEFYLGSAGRSFMTPFVKARARIHSHATVTSRGFPFYARTVHRVYGGEWDYDRSLKPDGGYPLPARTLAAVLKGQRRLARGLDLTIPVLVLCSTRTRFGAWFHRDMRRADVVLSVKAIAARAPRLGRCVTTIRVEGARHDVFCSDLDARSAAFQAVRRWAVGAFGQR
ncbi:alpha/beta hydrolase [Devriesea agamarum]|uniref:alpha/beta hydrolase n=1 Tax=Devriesea agamarum TaxID=472569 RepID=UPI00071DBBFC|nr:alpha/beta hydrolase [Devriesea agamarum]